MIVAKVLLWTFLLLGAMVAIDLVIDLLWVRRKARPKRGGYYDHHERDGR